MLILRHHTVLAPYTTIGLGGPATMFAECRTDGEIAEAIDAAESHGLRFHVLGGGSNTIFADSGFNGLVAFIATRGTSIIEEKDHVLVTAKAGEPWDPFVRWTAENGWAGLECLSGIPGSVGATPIQNVGAYGQEVKDVIESVTVLDRASREPLVFSNADCRFSYRMSRFKAEDADKFVVLSVTFRLKKNGRPTIHYPELQKAIGQIVDIAALPEGRESLSAVRTIVIGLRKKKSMVTDPDDVNSRSVGSFFLNPIVDAAGLERLKGIWSNVGDGSSVPSFPFEENVKIPAAWLIERSGFVKGYRRDGVGISANHPLALININGTSAALMALAEEVRAGVESVFGIRLEREANLVS